MTGPAGMSCQVYVDDNRLADTADEFLASTPTVLTGLSVTWGRSTVVDQPDVSTCSFTVGDIGGDADFLSLLHVGHIVDVYAGAAVSGGTDPVDVTVDGSFETSALADRIRVSGGTATLDTGNPYDGNRAVRLSTQASVRVVIPPGPFSTSPTAWNTIPKAMPGQPWILSAMVQLGSAMRATLQPVLFTSPAQSDGTPVGNPVGLPGASTDYQQIQAPWTADQEGWLGAVLTITGVVRWLDLVGPWTAQNWTWIGAGGVLLDLFQVLAPPQAFEQVLTFSGRITDLEASGPDGRVEVAVTASDRQADLGNDYIGDNPWLRQTIATRIHRITALAATPVTVTVDAWIGGRFVTWVDIDSQAVAGLLSDLATSADGVMWSTFVANRGFALWMEDPAQRQSMATLALSPTSGLIVITGATRPGVGVAVTACNLIGGDVRWRQDVGDVLSIVDVTWLQQLVDDDGTPNPTETHVVLTDAGAVATYGQRRLGYTTQLTDSADANTIATRLMARSRSLGWRVAGMTWDTEIPKEFSDDDRSTALAILNGSKRIGLPIVVTDLPAWTPGGASAPCYLEGGTYTFDGGRWTLGMDLSPAGLTGKSLTWAQTDPSFTWAKVDPTIAWFDMWGVGLPPAPVTEG